MEEVKHYHGHRKRLKERFFLAPESSPDYELLELVLFAAIPRSDVKPLAKRLISEFGSVAAVFNASRERMSMVHGVTTRVQIVFKVVNECVRRVLLSRLQKGIVLSSWTALIDYLRSTMGFIATEQFRIFFLDRHNALIADELQKTGTVDQTPVYPRELLKKIIYYDASAIIIAHNHPSGKVEPSSGDLKVTQQIVQACQSIGVSLHDHIVISGKEYYSFRANGLL